MQDSVIRLQNLSIGYQTSRKRKVVASPLNASLNKGEMTCLLGANGTGKSTLMRTICNFIPALNGNILLNDKLISKLSELDLARQISVVLTDKISIPNATLFELVAFGRSPFTGFLGKLTAEDKAIVNQSIERCGIAHKKHDLISSLSDGERQKATIAKALAQNTPYILLDEPTAFLDLPAKVEIMQLLRTLASSGKSILMSTHDLDLALQMADRLWIINQEKLIVGSPEDLILENAFQDIFSKGGIIFDNKTGLFKIDYQYSKTFKVKGHGFKYVLLRRAFSRKSISLEQAVSEDENFITINNKADKTFSLYINHQLFIESNSIEEIVKNACSPLNVKESQ